MAPVLGSEMTIMYVELCIYCYILCVLVNANVIRKPQRFAHT